METRSGVFAVAITVLLLMALTMNSVSAESKAKVKLGPSDTEKVKLNHSDADKVKLNSTDAVKVALNPSESMTFPTERALNELIYDDGTAENAYTWSSAGNGFAVQFTPLSYPVDLRKARICFWPDWPDSNHEEFAVYVYDDNGPSGEPGTCLGGPIYHTATAWGWCDVDISGLGITIENGDFYILYKQLTSDPDCEALCRDLSQPQYGRSWDYYYYDESWYPLWDENYMIRCVVDLEEKPDLIITEKWLCWPDNCTICYNVTNTGDGTAPACHNTALYVDGVAVAHDHVPVDLAPGESYTGCFNGYTWTYTPPSDEITVCADNNETLDELDEDNNCLTNIWMCGDVAGDGRVRMSDGRRIFRHLTFGDPIDDLWAADVTGDGRVRTSDGKRIFRHLTFGDPLNCKCSG